jgi:hypothetical protein
MVSNTIVDHSQSGRNPAVSLEAPSAGDEEGIKPHTVLQENGLGLSSSTKMLDRKSFITEKTGYGDEFEISDILYSKILSIQSNPSKTINTKNIKLRGKIKYYKMKKAM